MRIGDDSLITAEVDLSEAWESEALWLGHVYMYSIQLEFEGTPTGSFSLQCSNDRGQNNSSRPYMGTDVNIWTDIMGSSQSVSEAGDHTWDVEAAGYRWVKVLWTPSGTPTASLTSAKFSTKGQ